MEYGNFIEISLLQCLEALISYLFAKMDLINKSVGMDESLYDEKFDFLQIVFDIFFSIIQVYI